MRRRKRRNFANIVYSRSYYTKNICRYNNCIFNRNGRCLRLKKEQGTKPLTYNKGCFMAAVDEKTENELRSYFRVDSYIINRDLLLDHDCADDLFPPILNKEVKLLKVKDPTLVEVAFKVGDHVQHSTLFYRDLFKYELDNREREYREEEERLGKYVDFDAIRAVNKLERRV